MSNLTRLSVALPLRLVAVGLICQVSLINIISLLLTTFDWTKVRGIAPRSHTGRPRTCLVSITFLLSWYKESHLFCPHFLVTSLNDILKLVWNIALLKHGFSSLTANYFLL